MCLCIHWVVVQNTKQHTFLSVPVAFTKISNAWFSICVGIKFLASLPGRKAQRPACKNGAHTHNIGADTSRACNNSCGLDQNSGRKSVVYVRPCKFNDVDISLHRSDFWGSTLATAYNMKQCSLERKNPFVQILCFAVATVSYKISNLTGNPQAFSDTCYTGITVLHLRAGLVNDCEDRPALQGKGLYSLHHKKSRCSIQAWLISMCM